MIPQRMPTNSFSARWQHMAKWFKSMLMLDMFSRAYPTATSSAADAEGPAPMGKCYHDTERALGGDRHALQLGLPVLAPNVSAGTTGFRAAVGAFRK